MIFLSALSITLIFLGLGTFPEVLKTWRIRSDLNYERFARAYAEAVVMQHQARQAGERA